MTHLTSDVLARTHGLLWSQGLSNTNVASAHAVRLGINVVAMNVNSDDAHLWLHQTLFHTDGIIELYSQQHLCCVLISPYPTRNGSAGPPGHNCSQRHNFGVIHSTITTTHVELLAIKLFRDQGKHIRYEIIQKSRRQEHPALYRTVYLYHHYIKYPCEAGSFILSSTHSIK
jgi:hypothetical protein